MKVVVIGAVAAGTSAAAKASRNLKDSQITIYERDSDISYSGCGLPFYITGEVGSINQIVPRDTKYFKDKYNIDILTEHEVLEIDSEKQVVVVKNLKSKEIFTDTYDKLVIATGASSVHPNIEGIDTHEVFYLRNVHDARKIKKFIEEKQPKTALIAGTGFIGFELMESFERLDIKTTIVEIADKITPNLDKDMADYLEDLLVAKQLKILKSKKIIKIENHVASFDDNTQVSFDMIVMATGVRPNVALAKAAGVDIGVTGAIKTNQLMQTNIENIYACGDCVETFSLISGKPVYRPLGSTANKTGRIAGDNLSGGHIEYKGNLSTSIFRLFEYTIASTGLTEKEAYEEGYDVVISRDIKPDKPSYMGGKKMSIKAIADKQSGRILGVQIIGEQGVDKRIDVFVTLITYKATVDELFHIDLAYAPPFSTTKDPVHYTGMILDNIINKKA